MGRPDYLCPVRDPTPTTPRSSPVVWTALLAGLLAAVVALAAGAGTARAADPALSARLARALAVPHVDHSRSGALAVDLATGEVVFARNPTRALAPASTEKLALSFGLLSAFGPAYRITTRVLAVGRIEGATLHGSLILKGYGDPSLSSAGLRRLAAQVRALGLRRVTGPIVGDESFFDARRTAPGWKPSFYIGESAPLSALTVDRVRYGGRVSERPALAAAILFRGALAAAGVATPGRASAGSPAAEAQLASVDSPPLLQLLRTVNRESDNFTAEILLKHLGAARGAGGSTPAGAAVVRQALGEAGVSLGGVRIADGSGLSLLDRLTADALVDILAAAWADPLLRGSFLASLAVAGRNGTLARRLRKPPAVGQVFAKTGTTSRASALSGFVAGRYAFAVVQNGPPLSSWWARTAQDRFVTVLASLLGLEQPDEVLLVAHVHAHLARLGQLRLSGLLARDHGRRLAGDGVGDARALRLERGLRLVAGEALERPCNHVRLAGERPLDRTILVAGLEAHTERTQLAHEPPVLLVGEPLGDQLGAIRSDPVDVLELLLRRVQQRVDGHEVPGEVAGHHPAHLRDVQPEEDARERPLLPRRLDRGDRVPGRDLAVAVELLRAART